ncbi:MAG: bifunctional UDP-N-acetylglucosamine diphosphorylase/glucosamine-1-phosphate N-acetyltransferase GlmU [Nocardioides sp.]
MFTNLTVIVLAAGGGTRMHSKTNKVLHRLGGRSMIEHVLAAVAGVGPRHLVAVIGAHRDQVGPHIEAAAADCVLAVQEKQSGTGHAVQAGVAALLAQRPDALTSADAGPATVLVAYGDTPLLRADTLQKFVAEHVASESAVSILSGLVDDPAGYGRILRAGSGEVVGIVEQKDARADQREIREINSGILAFAADFLVNALPQLHNSNASGEYYLTDLVGLARADGLMVAAFPIEDQMQIQGANDRQQLAALGRELNRRLVSAAMMSGVTVVDPETTWIDADAQVAPDATLLPGTQLLGATTVARDAVIGPDTTLQDCSVGIGARIVRSHCVGARVDTEATVGPFAYLRPGTHLGSAAKIGAFVESKNADIGAGAKVPHLTYVGDADIGDGANIGAGTVFANYDGLAKHRSRVGRHARTASNNTMVAPVSIGDGAATGAGAVIRRDVPAGALGVSSGPQRNLAGWVARRWPGTSMARAASCAADAATGTQVGPEVPGETQLAAPRPNESN